MTTRITRMREGAKDMGAMSTSNGEYDPKVTAKKFAITGGLSSVLMIAAMAFARWKTNPEGFEPTGNELSTIGMVVWGVIGGVLTGAAKAWRNWQKNRKKGQPPAWVSSFAVLLCAAIGVAGCATPGDALPDETERRQEFVDALREHLPEARAAIESIGADLADGQLEPIATLVTLAQLADDIGLDVQIEVAADVGLLLDAVQIVMALLPETKADAALFGAQRALVIEQVGR